MTHGFISAPTAIRSEFRLVKQILLVTKRTKLAQHATASTQFTSAAVPNTPLPQALAPTVPPAPTANAYALPKSSAQVESFVAHSAQQNSGGLKPDRNGQPGGYDQPRQKSQTLGVRFRAEELVIVRTKAQLAARPIPISGQQS